MYLIFEDTLQEQYNNVGKFLDTFFGKFVATVTLYTININIKVNFRKP